jgi:hypothetical protein
MKLVIFSLVVFSLICCQTKTKKHENKIEDWGYLRITLDHHRSINFINHDPSDSTIVKTYSSGSFFAPVKNVKIKTEQFAFTQSEKDSIYSLVKEMVVHPITPKKFCTDFVGRIEINIVYNEQVTQSCIYTSVCDWTTLSDKTLRLHAILQKRIKDL